MPAQTDTIISAWQKICQKFPDSPCVKQKNQAKFVTLTYSDIENYSLKIACFLLRAGIKNRGTVALMLENCPEWLYLYLGILKSGAIAVPLDPQFTPEELINILDDCAAKIIFSSRKISGSLENLLKEKGVKVMFIETDGFSRVLEMQPAQLPTLKINADDTASILYTSGTTAVPKGVVLTHGNFLSDFESLFSLGLISSKDNFLGLLPFYHAYAFMGTVLMPILSGAVITIPGSFRSEEIIKTMQEAGVTIFVAVPQILAQIHKSILERIKKKPFFVRIFIKFSKQIPKNFGKNLRFIISGGARLEPEIARDLLKLGFTVLEGYGLTETSPVVSLNRPQEIKPGSAGKAIPGIKIKIVNPENYAIELPAKKIGEVAIDGENVMAGYFNKPRMTEAAIKDGWFLSGDLGYLDKKGNLFLTGRKKEIIVLPSGKNIDPEDLESHYLQTTYIKELCILDNQGILEALIVPDFDYFKKTGEINVEKRIHWVLENLSAKLPSYKRVMGFALVKEPLARTHLGKLKRYQIQEEFPLLKTKQKAQIPIPVSDEDLGLLKQESSVMVLSFLNKELKKSARLDDHLELDLGLDSISRIELGLKLERLLNIALGEEILSQCHNVRELLLVINKKAAQGKPLPISTAAGWQEKLRQEPEAEILKKIRLKPDVFDLLLNIFAKFLFFLVFRTCWFLRAEGKNNLPKKGPYIICPNHASFLDGLFIFTGIPLRILLNFYFIGYAIFFKYWFSYWLIKPGRIIPLDLASDIEASLRIAAFLLRRGKSLCIFPEGMRSIDKNLNEFKKGIGILGLEAGVMLVPVYIKGSHYSWPRSKPLPKFAPIKIIIGKPKTPKELLEKGRLKGIEDNYEAVAEALREEVLLLSGQG